MRRLEPLEEIIAKIPPGALVLFHSPRLDDSERGRLARLLRKASNPIVVLCPSGDPRVVFSLARDFPADRLIALESDLGKERLAEVLPRWHLAATLRPAWSDLRIPDPAPPLVARLQRIIDHDPTRNWSVEELADALRLSRSTLTRIVREATGRSPKTLLIQLRYQLIERARRELGLTTERVADLFEFPSPEEVHRWRYRHREMGFGHGTREVHRPDPSPEEGAS